MWCWLQEINIRHKYDLFHLDRHYDTLYSNINSWTKALPQNFGQLSLSDYLELKLPDGKTPIISYDNYLSIFLEKYSNRLDTCWFSTYNEGDKPQFPNMQIPPPQSLPNSLEYWLEKGKNPWIINLDIDMFFCDDNHDSRMQFHSDEYIKAIGKIIKRMNDKGKIAVITIALSPEWSGGWKKAIRACNILTRAMEVEFNLPNIKRVK